LEVEDRYRAMLKNRPRDAAAGRSLGPHLTDLAVRYRERLSGEQRSTGEQKRCRSDWCWPTRRWSPT
jgi:recombinational DNA repair ATPase RecF